MQKEAMLQACSHITEVQSAASILASTSQDSSQSEDDAFLAACAEFERGTLLPFGVFRAAAGCGSDARNLEFAAGPSAPARVPSPVLSTAVDSCSLATQQQVHEDETLLSVLQQCSKCHQLQMLDFLVAGDGRIRQWVPHQILKLIVICVRQSNSVAVMLDISKFSWSQEEAFRTYLHRKFCDSSRSSESMWTRADATFEQNWGAKGAQQQGATSARTEATVLRRSVAIAFATKTAEISAPVVASDDAVAALREGEALSFVMSNANIAVL